MDRHFLCQEKITADRECQEESVRKRWSKRVSKMSVANRELERECQKRVTRGKRREESVEKRVTRRE